MRRGTLTLQLMSVAALVNQTLAVKVTRLFRFCRATTMLRSLARETEWVASRRPSRG
jgi:hypothetical protein